MKYEKCLVMNTISHFSQGTKLLWDEEKIIKLEQQALWVGFFFGEEGWGQVDFSWSTGNSPPPPYLLRFPPVTSFTLLAVAPLITGPQIRNNWFKWIWWKWSTSIKINFPKESWTKMHEIIG